MFNEYEINEFEANNLDELNFFLKHSYIEDKDIITIQEYNGKYHVIYFER